MVLDLHAVEASSGAGQNDGKVGSSGPHHQAAGNVTLLVRDESRTTNSKTTTTTTTTTSSQSRENAKQKAKRVSVTLCFIKRFEGPYFRLSATFSSTFGALVHTPSSN